MDNSLTRSRNIAKKVFSHENAVLGIILGAIVAIMGFVTGGKSVAPANISNVWLQSSMRGVASVGQALVILTAGIDLSVGGVGLMSAILGAALMTSSPPLSITGGNPWPMLGVLPIMIIVAAGWGAFNGFLVSRTGIPALISTLGVWEITKGIGFELSKGRAVIKQPEGLAYFGSGTVAGVPVPVIIFIVTIIIFFIVLNYTKYGRSVYAVGGNAVSSWLSGINVKGITFSVYVLAGLLAGIAGIISNARLMSASMQTLTGLELDSIASVVIGGVSLSGGKGNIIGVLLGVLIVGVINNAMSILGASPTLQGIVKGAIIISAVVVDFVRRKS